MIFRKFWSLEDVQTGSTAEREQPSPVLLNFLSCDLDYEGKCSHYNYGIKSKEEERRHAKL